MLRKIANRFWPPAGPILAAVRQIRAWRRANRRMGWGIKPAEFAALPPAPELSARERDQGYLGSVLCYGFGDDGAGHADPIVSGRLAWEYAWRRRRGRIWQCAYAEFNQPQNLRLRPGAPPRPQGFYWVRFHPGAEFRRLTVAQFRRQVVGATGCGPEGFQIVGVSHPHFAELMNRRELNFMALADYDVAPHGFGDFFEAPQLFCSQGVLGFGVGNVDGPYPLFGIPQIRF